MGVRDLLLIRTDGGSSRTEKPNTHVECRQCGKNLTTDASHCPDCGGDVAVYDL